MAWIGVECDVPPGELEKWAHHLDASGAKGVAAFLRRCGGLASGAASGVNADDRLRQIERRAAESADARRLKAELDVRAVIGRALGEGADAAAVAGSLGLKGFRAGSAAKLGGGVMNGGVRKRLDAAQKCRPVETVMSVAARDGRYGQTWEGWAAAKMRDMGFKMKTIEKALGMSAGDCWRHLSGWTRHWRRMGVAGAQFPGPERGWQERLDAAVHVATGVGRRGPRTVLNGGRNCE